MKLIWSVVWLLIAASLSQAQTILFQDTFENLTIGSTVGTSWYNNANATAISNPFPTDVNNTSLIGAKVTGGTTFLSNRGVTANSAQDLKLTLQLDVSQGGTYYDVIWGIFDSGSTTGYGFEIYNKKITILKLTNAFTSPTSLISVSIPTTGNAGALTTTGWNNLEFDWTTSGELSVSLNGTILATATDLTYAVGVSSTGLDNKTYIQTPATQYVTYDNILLQAIPEPGISTLLGFGVLGVIMVISKKRKSHAN